MTKSLHPAKPKEIKCDSPSPSPTVDVNAEAIVRWDTTIWHFSKSFHVIPLPIQSFLPSSGPSHSDVPCAPIRGGRMEVTRRAGTFLNSSALLCPFFFFLLNFPPTSHNKDVGTGPSRAHQTRSCGSRQVETDRRVGDPAPEGPKGVRGTDHGE